jgi:hypothetical protein
MGCPTKGAPQQNSQQIVGSCPLTLGQDFFRDRFFRKNSGRSQNPRHGTAGIDPYARAMVARSGELPVGSGDGIAFLAHTDDSGHALNGRCDVLISGTTPQARYWTITLYDPNGALVSNSVQRHGFTSHEIVRRANGTFEITASPRSRPGNWLPTSNVELYVLLLRLYDTPIGVTTRGREVTMPIVTRKSCP